MAKIVLRKMQPKKDVLIRTFWYPELPSTTKENGVEVTLCYVNQAEIAELTQMAQTRIKQSGKIIESLPGAEQRRILTNEVLVMSVKRVVGMTFDKLRKLAPVDADMVRASGGLDSVIDMDSERSEEGKDNILYLLEQSEKFSQWVTTVATDISRFQDGDWETRAKNSESGASTTSDESAKA